MAASAKEDATPTDATGTGARRVPVLRRELEPHHHLLQAAALVHADFA